jgi:signal transduction histidine kinase
MTKADTTSLEKKPTEMHGRYADDREVMEALGHEIDRLRGILEKTRTVCHDLNQPLMAISGFSTLISMNLPEGDPVADMAGKMLDQVSKMGRLTQKLMHMAQNETKDDILNAGIDH